MVSHFTCTKTILDTLASLGWENTRKKKCPRPDQGKHPGKRICTNVSLLTIFRNLLGCPGDEVLFRPTRKQCSTSGDKVRVKVWLLILDIFQVRLRFKENKPRSKPSTTEVPNGRVSLVPSPKRFHRVVANVCASEALEKP